jgi:hypothetical protein
MILRAIKTQQLEFIYCVFAYNKNYEQIDEDEEVDSDKEEDDSDNSYEG